MRFYPSADINTYWERPPAWSLHLHAAARNWKSSKPTQQQNTICYWRDIEGAKMPVIMKKDLYFEDWPKQRINPQACLPTYYCVGSRFVRLESSYPTNFKCSKLPRNLKELQELNPVKNEETKSLQPEKKTKKQKTQRKQSGKGKKLKKIN